MCCKRKLYPGQLAVAGKLPAGQVGGTLVVVQYNIGSFWISSKIELATHCGVSSSWRSKPQKTTDYTLNSTITGRRQNNENTWYKDLDFKVIWLQLKTLGSQSGLQRMIHVRFISSWWTDSSFCLDNTRKKNVTLTYSTCLFCLTNSPKPKRYSVYKSGISKLSINW